MKAINRDTDHLIVKPAASGWVIEAAGDNVAFSRPPIAGISDDEGLLEWFASQLGFDGHKLQACPPNPGPEAKPAEAAGAPPPVAVTPDHLKHMVDRFLSWRLPENFAPDGGVTLTQHYTGAVGTNLLDAMQAEDMVLYMLEGLPGAVPAPPQVSAELIDAVRPFQAWAVEARDKSDEAIAWNTYNGPGTYAEVLFGQIRALIRAAGLWTQEMQAAPVQAAEAPSAAPVADTKPPPAGDALDEIERDERLAREEF